MNVCMCAGVHGARVYGACVHVCMCECMSALFVCVCRKKEGKQLHSQNKVSSEGVIPYLLCELMRDEWLCVLS